MGVAAAMLDRRMDHSHGVTILGDSYGLREKRRFGLVRAREGDACQDGLKRNNRNSRTSGKSRPQPTNQDQKS
ncbi:hypothetical protein [Cyanobium sp. CH-040]|uniref:hypothetical protein n=1 Tax=Cyanobium sp. CH-040 TaxID=2823708 RepID=UPI0020CE7A5B|nr:hypothetical protein [Cyanobium sp. CH-040]MCP9927042.1 hypothetical protein [Cyanobium sp. CH-040]